MQEFESKLVIRKNGYLVDLPTKKGGTVAKSVPAGAICFNKSDASDDIAVIVQCDKSQKILKVTIPGKPETQPTAVAGENHSKSHSRQQHRGQGRPRDQRDLSNISKAPPSVLGLPFNNPYSFLPFPQDAPKRNCATLHTDDEAPGSMTTYSGTLDLCIKTNSPLLTTRPEPTKFGKQEVYEALTIGDDVVVPATSIRGMLRGLASILTGGTLVNMNPNEFLCQDRDLNLGPRGKNSPSGTPKHVFLGEVIRPGTPLREGTIRLGETLLVPANSIQKANQGKLPRPDNQGKQDALWIGLDVANKNVTAISQKESARTPWKVKLSGSPVKKESKKEGAFRPNGTTIEIPAELWAEYSSRYRHGVRSELHKGDLVWLEHVDPEASENSIHTADDIASLQWARWGKSGRRLTSLLPNPAFISDKYQTDGKVDEVTNMFGQVALDTDNEAITIAGRIRPENLVFLNGRENLNRNVALAPMLKPHVSCVALYRDNDNPDRISINDNLKGYKVYRNTTERGSEAPWNYQTQGIFDESGKLSPPEKEGKLTRFCDLLDEGTEGRLRIAFTSCTKRELAVLILCCTVPWKIGGGRPLGLGAATTELQSITDEYGQPLSVEGWTITSHGDSGISIDGMQSDISDIQDRADLWSDMQVPVDRLRYPRAVSGNKNRKQRGGHAWFDRHATMRKGTDKNNQQKAGITALRIAGELENHARQTSEEVDNEEPLIAGQVLPAFDPNDKTADLLYGYDGFDESVLHPERGKQNKNTFYSIVPFDPATHVSGDEASGGNTSQNRESRREGREDR